METAKKRNTAKLTGWILSALLSLFLLFDGLMKVIMLQKVIEYNLKLGIPENTNFGIGLTLTVVTILYLIPRTSVLGAILVTAYLGGATFTHVRIGEPFIFLIVFGILIWIALYLRETQLKSVFPLISKNID